MNKWDAMGYTYRLVKNTSLSTTIYDWVPIAGLQEEQYILLQNLDRTSSREENLTTRCQDIHEL